MNVKTLARLLLWLVMLVVVGVGLTVCSVSQPAEVPASPTPAQAEPTQEVAAAPSPTPVPATDTPTLAPATEVATAEPTLEVTEEATAVEEPTEEPTVPAPEVVDVSTLSSDNCVNCHTNQETLQALAEDKTVASEATSGEG